MFPEVILLTFLLPGASKGKPSETKGEATEQDGNISFTLFL